VGCREYDAFCQIIKSEQHNDGGTEMPFVSHNRRGGSNFGVLHGAGDIRSICELNRAGASLSCAGEIFNLERC
jgi:hypothetical protein